MNLSLRKFLFPFISLLLFFGGCDSQPEESYSFSAEDLCLCYSEKVFTEIDQRLSRCLNKFHTIIDQKAERGHLTEEEKQKFKEIGVRQITLWLSARCLSYRESLITVLEDRLKSQNPEQALDTVKKYTNTKIDELPLRWDLLEHYLSASKWTDSELFLKRLLKAYPSSDYGYWVQAYFNHRRRDYRAARSSIDQAILHAKDENFSYILQLYKNAYGPIDRSVEQEIVLEFDYEDI